MAATVAAGDEGRAAVWARVRKRWVRRNGSSMVVGRDCQRSCGDGRVRKEKRWERKKEGEGGFLLPLKTPSPFYNAIF